MSKITWTDQQTIAQQITGLSDSLTLLKLKRDINVGASKFLAALSREYNRHSRFTDLVAGQQYYQLPEDGQKLKEVIVSTGSYFPPMEQISDEHAWRLMNMLAITGMPSHYWVRGSREFGLYPTPASDVDNGIEMVFSPKHIEMTQDDFTTGTIAIAHNGTTLTHSATGFTAKMVGQWFQNTDGSDENWYEITGFTSTSVLELGNVYQGTTITAATFRIGQVMDLPEECLEGPVDYAAYRHYLRRGDTQKAADFKALYQDSLDLAKETYGNVTESQVVSAEPMFRTYNPFRGDPPNALTS